MIKRRVESRTRRREDDTRALFFMVGPPGMRLRKKT
jgi:hypothetical protein